MNGTLPDVTTAASAVRLLLAEHCGWKTGDSEQTLTQAAAQALTPEAFAAIESGTQGSISQADLESIVNRLAIHESYFLRDPQLFELVESHVLPELAANSGETLRLWSAGCAKGEEAYSLASVASDIGLAARVEVLGTDIASDVIPSAREGVFTSWSVRGQAALDRGIVAAGEGPGGGLFRVPSALVGLANFHQMNLLEIDRGLIPHGSMDLIMCRNVLIYLTEDAIRRVAVGLAASLSPGGYLLCAPSDPDITKYVDLQRVRHRNRVCYRRPRVGEVPSSRRESALPITSHGGRGELKRPRPVTPRRAVPRPDPHGGAGVVPPPQPERVTDLRNGPDVEESRAAQVALATSFEVSLAAGVRELEFGSYETSITELRSAACIMPRSIYAQRMLAVAYLSNGEYQRAFAALEFARRELAKVPDGDEVPGFEGNSLGEIEDDLARVERAVVRSDGT